MKGQDTQRQRINAAQARMELLRQGLNTVDISQLTGLKPSTVSKLLLGRNRASGRAAIERALGMAFWTEVDEFNRRTLILTRYGVDPALVPAARLRRLLTELDVPGRAGAKTKEDLITLLARHAGVSEVASRATHNEQETRS